MIITPAATVAGQRVVETLGLVRGNTIRARNVGKDIVAIIKNLVGGEIEEYTKMMGQAREQALARMMDQANEVGADAVTDIRFTTSVVMGGAAEMLAFGNAVKLEKE